MRQFMYPIYAVFDRPSCPAAPSPCQQLPMGVPRALLSAVSWLAAMLTMQAFQLAVAAGCRCVYAIALVNRFCCFCLLWCVLGVVTKHTL